MDQFEKFENQLISSYESTLALEGVEICKEVESLNKDDDKFLIEKAQAYCIFCLRYKKDSLNKDLINKCNQFIDNTRNLRSIKNCLDYISKERKHQKERLED